MRLGDLVLVFVVYNKEYNYTNNKIVNKIGPNYLKVTTVKMAAGTLAAFSH